jgi:ABC-type branched-subunit amino acid transport system substrate-binding protein
VTQRASRRTAPAVLLAAAAALVLSSCGTRLSDAELAAGDTNTTAPVTAVTTAPGGSSGAVGPTSSTSSTVPNFASDTGVSATEVTIGLIVSKTSPLGAETFSAPMYGAQAYVKSLNARGGINGRTVRLIVCDDASTGAGNRRCVRKLIDDDKVFALVSNSILSYSGAEYVNSQGVPDIGSQPIDSAYEQYAHLFQIYGSDSPRDGTVGFDGKLTTGTEIYRYFRLNNGAKTAGIVAFNQSESLRYAALIEAGLKAEGYSVVIEQIDFALPNFEAAAIDMKARGVDSVFDAMDVSGNVALCRAMDTVGLQVTAKVLSVQSWSETVREQFRGTKACTASLYTTSRVLNYMDTQHPVIKQFRADMLAAFPDREDKMSAWTVEGWAGAMWFADAAASCGAALTRACVEQFMYHPEGYDAHGIFDTRYFRVRTPGTTSNSCLTAAKWDESAQGGRGAWVSSTPVGEFVCYETPSVEYSAG